MLVIAGGVFASLRFTQRDLVTVQTGKVAKTDLVSQVTASGEIKPRNYINLGANAQGRITDLMVKEGDRVRAGQTVARIESVQANADVQSQRAGVASAEADSAATTPTSTSIPFFASVSAASIATCVMREYATTVQSRPRLTMFATPRHNNTATTTTGKAGRLQRLQDAAAEYVG